MPWMAVICGCGSHTERLVSITENFGLITVHTNGIIKFILDSHQNTLKKMHLFLFNEAEFFFAETYKLFSVVIPYT